MKEFYSRHFLQNIPVLLLYTDILFPQLGSEVRVTPHWLEMSSPQIMKTNFFHIKFCIYMHVVDLSSKIFQSVFTQVTTPGIMVWSTISYNFCTPLGLVRMLDNTISNKNIVQPFLLSFMQEEIS